MNITMLAIIGLSVLVVGILFYAILYNSIANNKKSAQRIKSMQVDQKTKVKVQNKRIDEKQRRKARESTLKNVEEQRSSGKQAAKPGLSVRIQQAGMTISMRTYYIICVVMALVSMALAALFTPSPWYAVIGIGIVCGVGLPYWNVNRKREKRFKSFILAFPNAIDVIVRGIRSGLPLNDCLRVIAQDAEEPVKTEFRHLIEATQMGLTVPDACGRLYDAIPTPETNFFSIVISIQSSAGGNLSEALGNLSKVLRERRKMTDKVAAFSTEAKSSAAIIGSLPFVVGGLVYLVQPDYLSPLWETTGGNKVLIFCAFSMGFGIFVMKKMINFKF